MYTAPYEAEEPRTPAGRVSVPARIYAAAGCPPVEGDTPGSCATCGLAGAMGVSLADWIKPTFTDHDLLRPGEIVCRACLLLFTNNSTFLQRRLGRDKPQKPWNWSHFVLRGEWLVLSKGDKAAMRDVLLQSPEVAVIAESGQKHLAFRARPHVWQFELQAIPADPDGLSRLLALTDALYTAGANKAEILSGHYSQGALQRIGVATWRPLELAVRPHRGTPLLDLAVFLTLKQEAPIEPDRPGGPTADAGGQFALL